MSSSASLCCNECKNEVLCEQCAHPRGSQTLTRDNLLLNIGSNADEATSAQTEKETMLCDPCKVQEKMIPACVFCEDCDSEFLCEVCEKHHKAQKLTRNHILHDISNYEICFKGTFTEKQNKFCEPCKAQEKVNQAVFFCKQCHNELLCESCGNYHPFQRITRGHILEDIRNFVELIPDNITNTKLLPCDPCKAQEKNVVAAFFCIECGNELLCDPCAKYHSSQKLTRDHQLQEISIYTVIENDPDTLKNQMRCGPCKAQGTTIDASFFCIDCGHECLCEACGKYHNLQKITQLHRLQTISKYVKGATFESISKLNKFCQRCKVYDKESVASFFCTECDNELFCKACEKHHSSQKMTRGHTLQDINRLVENANADDSERQINHCEPCKIQGKTTPASVFCAECENECMCESCGRYHESRKATLGHILQDIIMFNEDAGPKIVDKQIMVCEQCKAHEKSSKATVVCVDCEHELLCGPCGKYHTSRKSTRTHILQDIRMYFGEAIASGGEVAVENKLCKLCKVHGKKSPAVYICSECENERFCESCGQYHNRQKSFRYHLLQKIDCQQNIILANASDCSDMHTPGPPVASNIGSDTVTLSWTKPGRFKEGDCFQIGCRESNESRWKICQDNIEDNSYVLKNLRSNSNLVFRVRAMYNDFESNYSEESDIVTTPSSPASRVVDFCTVCGDEDKYPISYVLPASEVQSSRNCNAKTRRFEVGSPRKGRFDEKTILLIGETGTGKSTLVDGMANVILGVNWNDPFRFKMVNLEDEEKQKKENQALSQTEWITCYTMHPQKGGRLQYTINIIDTPGFGDTRGLQRDHAIVEQIRELFSVEPPLGVAIIDAVCFLVKAPDARLTPTQSYIFQSIMSMFGNDIEENICSLITFADGLEPPVIAALKESKLPFGKWFTFNNSALFAKNTELDQSSLSPMFWDMGLKSFQNFFQYLEALPAKSLQLTSDVLNERFRLEATVKNLEPLLDTGLIKIDELKFEIKCFEDNKAIIADNKDFKYKVQTTKQEKKNLPIGQHVTNCLNCHFTCHEKCRVPNDEKKRKCSAMNKSTGYCKICPENCFWNKHSNTPYIFEYIVVEEEKTYAEMKKKYQDASGKLPNQEQLIVRMDEELQEMLDTVDAMMDIVNTCNNRLKEIALRPNPLSMTEHIDLLIENEKMVKKKGWNKRITSLQMFRKRSLIGDNVDKFRREASTVVTVAIKNDKSKKNIFKRAWNCFAR
ncbi:uncharacterized protein LOC127845834 [Dreissena polymorpha]|uniref:Fibronectin type-III domain-containing protein n=1 Tax=Dreissena polymorpha TaxID=45954 RepID=A0A9D4ILJ1_DREPO|nr:uncharacterized protein LOC127845834 [Dreissena polymorpha]XP_052232956.1 uncharacterized protein LOC127845834 [Dreissena polymorpha]KAH3777349.1 hypothetical protein DPMN_178789 [Dreissena polymorpha]